MTSLDDEGTNPWHLKMHVESTSEDGTRAEGSIEEWWASPMLHRVVYSLPGYTGSELRNADGLYRSGGTGSGDLGFDMLLRQIVHPMPTSEAMDQGMLMLQPEQIGSVKLDCVMLGQAIRGVRRLPLGLFPTYCLDPTRDLLRLTYDFGGVSIVRNTMGRFLERSIPMETVLQSGQRSTMKARIETLKTMALTATDFASGSEMKKVDEAPVKLGSGVTAGSRLAGRVPVYPEEAKRNHVSGMVVLHAIIGRDGRVHSLVPVSYPDGSLAVSAIEAVRSWTYKPYLLNDQAVDVDTTITVHYNIGLL